MDGKEGARKTIVGRYQIVEEIGSGGFSNVYRAHDPVLDRAVALKVMRPFLMSEPEFVVRFQREAKTAANLDHPNIVPIYDHGEADGWLYIVMKLMDDGSLAIPLAEGRLPWPQVVALTNEIAAALDYAHEHGLVHRDIKPENVLLDARGQAQVCDFGVVKALEQSTTTLTMSGGILGSPAYIAPEIWNGKPPTGAADIYALACLVFEMVTGRKLYDAPTPPAAMALHFRPRQYPESWPENTPPGLEAVLDRALARDPAERYPTATTLADALAALEEDPLAEPYEALLAAIESEKWPDAVELAESISAQDEEYKDVRQLMAQAVRARADMEKMVWVSQWREQADSAMKAGEWQTAITAAGQWLQLSPDDAKAKDVIDRANEALEAEEEPAAAEEPVSEPPADALASTYSQLQESVEDEDWEQALVLAQSIVAQDSGYRDVQDYLARVKTGQEAAERAAEIDRLKAEAQAAVSAGDWERALQAAEAWQELAPNDPAAKQMVRRSTEALKEAAAPAVSEPEIETNIAEQAPATAEPVPAATGGKPPSVPEYFANYRRRLRSGELGLLPSILVVIVLIAILQIAGGELWYPDVIDHLINRTALISTIAIGVFFVLVIGEIDLSAAYVPVLAGLVLVLVSTTWRLPGVIAIAAALILATAVGLLQGWTISRFELPSYMVTLAGLVLLSGLAMVVFTSVGPDGFAHIDSETIHQITRYRLPPALAWIVAIGVTAIYGYLRLSGRGISAREPETETPLAIKIGQVVLLGLVLVLAAGLNSGEGILLIAPILLLLLFVASFVATRTRFGRDAYTIGQDQEAALEAGINVRRTRTLVFGLSALMAGLGGIFQISMQGGAVPAFGDIFLLAMAVSAAVIGGVSVYGSRGRMIGVLIGAFAVALIDFASARFAWDFGVFLALMGLVFVLGLAIDARSHLRRLRQGEEG